VMLEYALCSCTIQQTKIKEFKTTECCQPPPPPQTPPPPPNPPPPPPQPTPPSGFSVTSLTTTRRKTILPFNLIERRRGYAVTLPTILSPLLVRFSAAGDLRYRRCTCLLRALFFALPLLMFSSSAPPRLRLVWDNRRAPLRYRNRTCQPFSFSYASHLARIRRI